MIVKPSSSLLVYNLPWVWRRRWELHWPRSEVTAIDTKSNWAHYECTSTKLSILPLCGGRGWEFYRPRTKVSAENTEYWYEVSSLPESENINKPLRTSGSDAARQRVTRTSGNWDLGQGVGVDKECRDKNSSQISHLWTSKLKALLSGDKLLQDLYFFESTSGDPGH